MAHERTASFTPEAKQLIEQMLHADPKERLDVTTVFCNDESNMSRSIIRWITKKSDKKVSIPFCGSTKRLGYMTYCGLF